MPNNTSLAERRATLLQAAAQVGRAITSILDPDELLERAVDIICEAYGFYYAGVFLIDETGKWAVLRAGYGAPGAAMLAEGYKLEVGGRSMVGAATSMGNAMIALDVGKEPVHLKNPHLPLTRSEMALPLIVGGKVIGALTVQSTEEAAFSSDDITALQAMADQLAIAIQNARFHQEVTRMGAQAKRHATLLAAAAEVGRNITSILDLDELLRKAVDIICDAYGFYYAGVFLIDETGKWAVLRAGRGDAGAAMIAEGHRLEVGGHSMIGTATGQRRALIALDVGEEPVHFKNPHLPLTRSEMALPLIVGNEVIGALTVQSTEEAAFSDEDITSLQAMADQLAIAIQNARLLKELEAAHAELVRTKTFEAIATTTNEAIHWIGNKALPISVSVGRLKEDLQRIARTDPDLLRSMHEDLALIDESARLILSVKEHLIGPAREEKPRAAMLDDVVKDTAVAMSIPPDVIHTTVWPNLPLGRADTTQLSRAVRYVLQNALEAIADAQEQRITVEIAPAEEGRYVAIRIADSGPGIPDEDKIWATFYTTKGRQHAGLGLSACLQIIRQIEGKVSAANQPGGGAVIEMLIPVFDGVLPAPRFSAGKSILLVDDDDPWSHFARQVLKKAGNVVSRSADGQADLQSFDLILLDDVLETADTLVVLDRLRAAGAGGKTLVLASSLRVERTMELMRFGARDVLLKPYTETELAEMVGD